MKPGISRRHFLLSVLASIAVGCSRGEENSTGSAPTLASQVSVWLPRVIGDPVSSARLGRVYLAAHPEFAQRARLLAVIEESLTQGDTVVRTEDPQRIVLALHTRVRDDYISAQVLAVSGWVLSITEARLYALAALI